MKLLWVKADFLHPTNRGGRIRSLETLKRLHQRHEVHYAALNDNVPEAVEQSRDYCTRAYAIDHHAPERGDAAFAVQLIWSVFSPLPLIITRYRSDRMKSEVEMLSKREKFDAIVCDFLNAAPNMPDLAKCVLFQHNVEAIIWKRHAENAPTPVHRFYFQMQADRVAAYEGQVCRSVKSIIAVSPIDADLMRKQYSAERVNAVATGVDLDYFAPPSNAPHIADLVFIGSMDWMPNIDGAQWFVREILPLIRRQKPDCSVAFAGREPAGAVLDLAKNDRRIQVTGTVPDVRPYVWGATLSIVPLRSGGGTRLKIFESMAARVPVVSTTVGAEGLPVENGIQIHIADQPQAFADRCLELMDDPTGRARMADAAFEIVSTRFSWEAVSMEFERLLQS